MDEAAPGTADGAEMVELARAHDRLEATIWTRHLEEMGIPVQTRTIGGWLSAILYLGRLKVGVYVPKADYERAHEFLTKSRFI